MHVSGKKAFFHKLLSNTSRLISKKKTVAFYTPKVFHYSHIAPVVKQLSELDQNEVNIIIICPEKLSLNFKNVSQIPCSNKLPIWQTVDLFITTELGSCPYWLNTKRVFFLHGIGPKLEYQSFERLAQFDYLFSTCTPIHDFQSKLFNPKKIIKVGLPILDEPQPLASDIANYFNLNKGLPSIVYAPSWCNYPEHIADIDKALQELNTIDSVNVIVCPHPNLLNKKRCGGIDFFKNHFKYSNLSYNFAESSISTLEICNFSEVIISDISSILFESMALDKVVLLENNEGIFKKFGASAIYEQLKECCYVVDWNNITANTLETVIKEDSFKSRRKDFIRNYIFNKGNATATFISAIARLIKT